MTDPTVADRHVYGDPLAPVTVLEYGDLECPYCRAASPVLRELVDGAEGRVRLVWRHFPLFEVHPHALTAALAVEAAAVHGRFWELRDDLMSHQDHLSDRDLRASARSLGLDPDEVVGDAAQRFARAVQDDYAAGVAAGVTGTPTIFVGGVRYEGRPELRRLREAVARAAASTA
ncbi:DsbA family protein [Cellulomonas sp. URHB0016]